MNKKIRTPIDTHLADDEKVVVLEGYDDAVVGVVGYSFDNRPVLCYSVKEIIKILVERDRMTEEGAYEFFDFNIAGAYYGKNGPAFLYT